MNEDDKNKDRERLRLVTNRRGVEPETYEQPEEDIAQGDAYATAKGQRNAAYLQFRRKDGTSFAMPYGYRPILWGHPPDSILIEYPGFFTVALTGKDLNELSLRITDQRVTWIRECDETEAAMLSVAVTRIEILRAYPSREAGKETGDDA
jgi:hypothetical protein